MSLFAVFHWPVVVLAMVGCGVALFAGAARGADGGDWQLVRSMAQTFDGPGAGQTHGEMLLMGIAFKDKKRGVIGGFNDPTELRFNNRFGGIVGYTEDGGRTFKFIKTPQNVWTVTHAGGDTFWAVGYRNLLMCTGDAGKTWKKVRGPGGGMPSVQLDFSDPNHGVLVTGGRDVYTTTNGKRFNKADVPDPARSQASAGKRSNYLRGAALGAGGFGVVAGGDGELLVTRDGGKTWAVPASWRKEGINRVANYLRSAAAVGEKHAWMVGDDGIVVRTADGGETFDVSYVPDGDFLTAVQFADTKRGWALGWHNAYRSEDSGKTWRIQETAGGTYMQGLSVLDADTAWIAGHYGVVQHTTDAGRTWRALSDYTDLYAVAMVDERVGYAGADSGAIVKTTDGGKTWRYLASPRGRSVEALQFRDAKTGWGVGDFGLVVYTTDGGDTFGRGKIDFDDILKDIHMHSSRKGIAVGASGAIFSTADGGATWKRAASPTDKMLYAVDFPTAKTGYACGVGVVLKTTDGGATWKQLTSPTIDILSDVRFTSATRGVMAGDVGRIFLTEDGGKTWKQAACPTREWLHRIEIVNAKTFLVAGSRGTIVRSTDGGAAWTAMTTAARNNVYCISGRVAVGRWGQVQIVDAKALARPAGPAGETPADLYENAVLPRGVTNVPAGKTKTAITVDDKGRLTEVTVNGRTYPTNKQFPTVTVCVPGARKGNRVKVMRPDDKAWTIKPARSAKGARAYVFDSDLLTLRVTYTELSDRLVVEAKVVKEKKGRLIKISTGDEKFVRLMGDTPDALRRGALAVPVDGGEKIPFSAFSDPDRNVLQKTNSIGGWTFKSRMISFTDGTAGLILRSHQWKAKFHYGQSAIARRTLPVRFLYLGWSFDTRVDSAKDIAKSLDANEFAAAPPAWLTAPMPIDTFGFDLQYVGDVNDDRDVNWVDAGITYREGNYKRTRMIDESPGMCGDMVLQAPTCFMLWDNPYLGNTHSDSRALARRSDGRPAYKWGAWGRSIAYELDSGRLARFYDKIADDFDFPRMPVHFGTDTWTCASGSADFSAAHPRTAEQSARAKVAALQLLARKGYRTDSEALSEWGLAGNLLWGWWTPYVGNGVWPGGFSRCWQYIKPDPRLAGSPVAHLYAEAIPLQTVIFQGVTYSGAGSRTPPAYAILHGGRPMRSGIYHNRHNEFFYYPWLVLWKTISPHRTTNVRLLADDLWELTYEDGAVLKLDMRSSTWVLTRGGITYDGYSPPDPHVEPRRTYGWGVPHENFRPRSAKGSFAVWRSGTFTIKVPGIKAIKPPRVVGSPNKHQKPPPYKTHFSNGVLSITIEGKDPVAHPMLVFETKTRAQ